MNRQSPPRWTAEGLWLRRRPRLVHGFTVRVSLMRSPSAELEPTMIFTGPDSTCQAPAALSQYLRSAMRSGMVAVLVWPGPTSATRTKPFSSLGPRRLVVLGKDTNRSAISSPATVPVFLMSTVTLTTPFLVTSLHGTCRLLYANLPE